jgi:hypothetical protein
MSLKSPVLFVTRVRLYSRAVAAIIKSNARDFTRFFWLRRVSRAREETLVSLPFSFSSGGGLEGSDLRRGLPEPSKAVFVFKENNDGSGGHTHTLSKVSRMGEGRSPCYLLAGGDVFLLLTDVHISYDFCCYFKSFMYNIRILMKDIQVRSKQDPLARKLQSATAYLETLLELYQRTEDPLELIQPLHTVMGMLQDIRREVLTRELTTVLNNEDLPETVRKEKVVSIFQLLT